MLQCFIDDSGHNNGPVLVLAGFIADANAWRVFSDDWQAVLDLPPQFDYLRMREAWGRRYPRWAIAERDERLVLFREVIIKHAVGAIRVAVPREAYRRTVGQVHGWSDYYQFALYQLIKMYRKHHAKLGLARDISFIFDDQQRSKRRIERAWRFFQAAGNEHLLAIMGGLPEFEDDKKMRPLQAADMLAWVSRRRTAAHMAGEEEPAFPWGKGDGIPTLDAFCSKQTLQRTFEEMSAPVTAEEMRHMLRFRGF
jgi:hypothetical protein